MAYVFVFFICLIRKVSYWNLLGSMFHTNQNCFHNTTSKTVVSLRTIPILEVVQQWIKNQWQRNISLQNKVSIVCILFFITFLNHKISCKLYGYRMSSWGKNKLTSDIWISGSVSALGGFSLTGWAWNVIQWII